jgi:dihydroorotase
MMRLIVVVAASLLVSNSVWAQARYDLLLKGGHVIDPKNQIDGMMDVAIAGGKIARVAPNIPAAGSTRVADVSGLYVTPGLVDMHVHVHASSGRRNVYAGDNSVYPDGFTFRSGVTTVVDLGTTGWREFPDFKDRVIDRVRTRVLAFLNIVGSGMIGTGADRKEEQNTQDMDAQATAKRAREFPAIVVGIKTAHYTGPDWTAVDRAVEAAKLANLPVAVDFGNFNPARPFADLVTKHLRPGDMSTHSYKDLVPFLDDRRKAAPVGHGGSQSWRQVRCRSWRRWLCLEECHPGDPEVPLPSRLAICRRRNTRRATISSRRWRNPNPCDQPNTSISTRRRAGRPLPGAARAGGPASYPDRS